jgi:hypothetical protein
LVEKYFLVNPQFVKIVNSLFAAMELMNMTEDDLEKARDHIWWVRNKVGLLYVMGRTDDARTYLGEFVQTFMDLKEEWGFFEAMCKRNELEAERDRLISETDRLESERALEQAEHEATISKIKAEIEAVKERKIPDTPPAPVKLPEDSPLRILVTCQLCHNKFSNDLLPLFPTKCEHVACADCWEKTPKAECPFCRRRIKKGSLKQATEVLEFANATTSSGLLTPPLSPVAVAAPVAVVDLTDSPDEVVMLSAVVEYGLTLDDLRAARIAKYGK